MFSFFTRKKTNQQIQLPFYIDLHSHVLPGLDDGSPNLETSVELIKSMTGWGIQKIITTPHVADETFPNNKQTIDAAHSNLKPELDKHNINIKIHCSPEYRLDEGFLQKLDSKTLIPFPKNNLLIENSYLQPFWDIENLIFKLKLEGFYPILAHPERYNYYHKDKKIYDKIQALGCEFQVNLLSFSGYYGRTVQEVAMWLLSKGYIDYIGTDLHHKHHVEAIESFLSSKDYIKILPKLNVKNDNLI